MPQFKNPHNFNYEQAKKGLKMLLWGMFLKVVIADRIGIYVDTVYGSYTHFSGAVCFFASVMYTLQIYCDFAGYSLMAIGIAKQLGFNLINNFERPYLAASVTEFWKRWHISLTRWLTTHVYINLGRNRCSKIRQYVNIMITFLVSGLWHGANWTFVVWGALHGVFQIVEKALMGDNLKRELKNASTKLTLSRCLRITVTFLLVSFAWIYFRMPSMHDANAFVIHIFSNFNDFSLAPMDSITIAILAVSLPLLFVREILEEYGLIRLQGRVKQTATWLFYIFLFCFLLSFGVLDGGQFIYVSF